VRVALLAVLVACPSGCNQILGIGDFHLGDDQGSDVGMFCLGSTALYKYCAADAPMGAVTLSKDIDTDSTQDCQTDAANGVCVIAADTIGVQRVAVTGSLPLVLVAGSTIEVTDVLDGSSGQAMPGPVPHPARTGPGSTAAGLCAGPAGMDSTQGAGAGAGGSFGDIGADGEDGGSSANIPGGTATDAATLTKIQAGCAGGKGGDGDTVGSGGLGGVGGGAIYLVAGTSIHVTSEGAIYASGQGGVGANKDHGAGGGGGAGGLIGLDAPQVTVEGFVVANGAAGGEGANGSSIGADGDDGTTSVTMARRSTRRRPAVPT